jgi:zinc protease
VGNRQRVLDGFETECRKLMDHPVGHEELAEAKENILGRRVVFLETAPQQCSYIASQMAIGLTLAEMDALPERIESVTALEIQDVARKYLDAFSVISVVGPSHCLN